MHNSCFVKQVCFSSVLFMLGISSFLAKRPQCLEPKPVSGTKPTWDWDFSGFVTPFPRVLHTQIYKIPHRGSSPYAGWAGLLLS